jgi:hypothetical protein
MSTLNVNRIVDASGGVFAPVSSVFRSRIINGGMVIDQRNAGAAITGSGEYPVDRFVIVNSTDGAFSAQQDSSAPTGFVNSLKVTTTTADGTLITSQQLVLLQNIEGYNVADLNWGTANAKTVTLSFWVRSSLTGTFGGALRNSAADRSYPFTYTISTANTWEQKSITVAGDTTGTWLTTNGRGISLVLGLGAGPDRSGTAGAWAGATYSSATGATSVIGTLSATFYITGVQLEVGTQATSFEYRQYQQELALCQRYYYKIKAASTNVPFGTGFNFSTTASATVIPFPVSMRIEPTALEQSGTAADYRVLNSSASSVNCSSVPVFATASVDSSQVNTTVSSGLTQGDGTIFRATNTSAYLAWSAEL